MYTACKIISNKNRIELEKKKPPFFFFLVLLNFNIIKSTLVIGDEYMMFGNLISQTVIIPLCFKASVIIC